MAKKKKESPESSGVNISIEQICAAILQTVGSVEVQLDTLLSNYSEKSIAIVQDEKTNALTFSLSDVVADPITE